MMNLSFLQDESGDSQYRRVDFHGYDYAGILDLSDHTDEWTAQHESFYFIRRANE